MDLVLVWDLEVLEYEEDRKYEPFMESQGSLAWPQPALRAGLEKALRLWSFGLLLNSMERYKESGNKLREAMEMYGEARRSPSTYPNHRSGVAGTEEVPALSQMGRLVDEYKLMDEEVKSLGDQIPLQWAVARGHEAMVELLLERGADIEVKDQNGLTPLWWATVQGREAVVKLLLERGVDTEAKDQWGRTPLSWATKRGHEAIVKLLLERGADIETKDELRQKPLSRAAEGGHEAIVKMLLERGADIETRDRSGQTPLSRAAEGGHEAVVKLLRSAGGSR